MIFSIILFLDVSLCKCLTWCFLYRSSLISILIKANENFVLVGKHVAMPLTLMWDGITWKPIVVLLCRTNGQAKKATYVSLLCWVWLYYNIYQYPTCNESPFDYGKCSMYIVCAAGLWATSDGQWHCDWLSPSDMCLAPLTQNDIIG